MSAARDETADIEAMTAHIRAVIDRLIERTIERGASTYLRSRDLPLLLRNWELMSDAAIIRRLEEKAKAEAARLIAGWWCADSNRLIALKTALHAEKAKSNQ